MSFHTITTNLKARYRYWRYLARDSTYGDIAELSFWNDKNIQVMGIPMSTEPVDSENGKEAAFDNNPLTYFEGMNGDKNWIGMKFNSPKNISKIRYLPRNDDNFINVGNLYELFYWMNGDWKSIGQKVGSDSQQLVYNNVPSGALLLLRNHTHGKEERIFTYEGSKQIWW